MMKRKISDNTQTKSVKMSPFLVNKSLHNIFLSKLKSQKKRLKNPQ